MGAPSDDVIESIPGAQFILNFLGTGAGTVRIKRNCTSTALVLGGETYLFDAGEGIQRQSQLSRKVRLGDVTKIFISHLHGDHIFGLPGLLLSLQHIAKHRRAQLKKPTPSSSSSSSEQETNLKERDHVPSVQVYGPVGLYNYIAATLSLSCTELRNVHVDVYELTGGSRRWVHPASIKSYGEFRHRGLRRHAIPQDKDGTWTLQQANEVHTVEDARNWNDARCGRYVKAAQIWHVAKLQCFGFVVQEPWTQARRIHVDKATAAGVAPGNAYKLLKLGFPVPSDDGTRTVYPDEVCLSADEQLPNKSRKVAILGDCCAVPRPMAELCHGADVLVHEATFLESDFGPKVDVGGHSTAAMAAKVAQQVEAKVLLLNHITAVNHEQEAKVVEEATDTLRNSTGSSENIQTKVQLSYDLMEFTVPRQGFPESLFSQPPSPAPRRQNATATASTETPQDPSPTISREETTEATKA